MPQFEEKFGVAVSDEMLERIEEDVGYGDTRNAKVRELLNIALHLEDDLRAFNEDEADFEQRLMKLRSAVVYRYMDALDVDELPVEDLSEPIYK